MLRLLIEIVGLGGWGLVVIISSNAVLSSEEAAQSAKARLGKAFPFVVIAGIGFSIIAGAGLVIFVLERVFGVHEIDISYGNLWRGIDSAVSAFNEYVLSFLIPQAILLWVSGVLAFFSFVAVSIGVTALVEKVTKRDISKEYVSVFVVLSMIWLVVG